MRWVTFVLIVATAWFQGTFWLGKGGWHDMWNLKEQLVKQEQKNQDLTIRNTSLEAEVMDLTDGDNAITEIARVELGYIQSGEVFYRIVDKP